jgi:ERCC4-type nuclease
MHKIDIVVDTRERALYDDIVRLLSLQKAPAKKLESVEIHFKTLELGDIKVVLSENDTVVRELSMERKTPLNLARTPWEWLMWCAVFC